jgi:hypothetical protein
VGSTQATVGFTVNFRLRVSYPADSYAFPKGQVVPVATPTVTNGIVNSWSISPALPPGLAFDSATGSISGTPTAASASRLFTVTAHGLGGDAIDGINLEVTGARAEPQLVVDVGHASGISEMEMEGNRLQSRSDGKIILWSLPSGSIVATMTSDCPGDPVTPPCAPDSDMAGPTLAVRVRAGWDLYATADGAHVASIAEEAGFDFNWSLASDGSYLVTQGPNGIKAYSATSGATLLTRAGDYTNAKLFAAPGEIRAGNLASGAQVVENIAVPSGAVTTTPFVNAFHSWFADGERFFTYTGSTARIYTRSGTQLEIVALPSLRRLRGLGDHYWITEESGNVKIYAVGSGGVPALTTHTTDTEGVFASGPELLVRTETATARTQSIVNLSGATPVEQNYVSPQPSTYLLASTSANQRAFAGGDGVLWTEINGTRHILSRGKVRSLAASSSRVAIATAAGEILIHDAQTGAYLDTIERRSSKVVLSADGTVLAVGPNLDDAQYDTDRGIRVYALPSKNLIHEWPATYSANGPMPFDLTLSPAGDRIGISMRDSFTPAVVTLSISALDGTVAWSNTRTLPTGNTDHDGMRVNFSPDGTRHAVADGAAQDFRTGTTIYQNYTLGGAATGWPVGWIDDTHLLVNRFTDDPAHFQALTGAQIVDPTGAVLTSPTLPQMWQFQPAGPHAIYSPEFNEIYDTVTGGVLWTSYEHLPSPTPIGAVGAGKVFNVSGSAIRSEPYP